MTIREEKINDVFTKYHLDGTGIAMHFFHGIDNDDPHDHPWDFTTRIVYGGYVEVVYTVDGNSQWHSEVFHRKEGEIISVRAEHIHKIIHLPKGICWTEVKAKPEIRKWSNWRFNGDEVLVRRHDKEKFKPFSHDMSW